MANVGGTAVTIRRARTSDVPAIRTITNPYVEDRVLIAKDQVTYYEGLQEFRVAEIDGVIAGCGALHIFWEDLAEIRTLATDPAYSGLGVGGLLLEQLLADAREIGVRRVFCLTFKVPFFRAHGFEEIEGTPVTPEVFAELLRSHDEGVAGFLDLARVKPNTLGNTRMLRHL